MSFLTRRLNLRLPVKPMKQDAVPLFLLCLALLGAARTVRAQAERPEVPRHADPVVQGVQAHLDRLCEAHDARLAAIRTPEQLRAEISTARKRFLALLD